MTESDSKHSVCFVTAYLDIKRDEWSTIYKRSFGEYLSCFLPFVDLFEKTSPTSQSMLVFIDKAYIGQLESILRDRPSSRIRLFPIDQQWLADNLPMWRTLERERGVMSSESFKKLIPASRRANPETYVPEYTLINHCKIDYIKYAIQNLSDASYFSWVDFGYFKTKESIPDKLLDIRKLDLDRINYTLLNPITDADRNVGYTLAVAPERIAGYFFFGSREMMIEYQQVYHELLNYYQNTLNVADDDQALVMACYFTRSDLFCLHYMPQWHSALVKLSLSS